MTELKIEQYITEYLSGGTLANALDFTAFLRAFGMVFERCRNGYWEDKLYWTVKYKNETVFQIFVNGYESGQWVVWSDDSGVNWFANEPLDERAKEIAWANVGFCGKGGCCRDMGTRKIIFGRAFDDVCLTALRFDNPNADAVDCMKKISAIRKSIIG
jgi:hypothetical protein